MGNIQLFFKNLAVGGYVVLFLLLGVAGWGGHYLLTKNKVLDKAQRSVIESTVQVSKDADAVIAYNTFPGMEGILYMNGGMEPNENCELYRRYHVKLQIKKMDVAKDTRTALQAGVLDLVYCTTDALSVEMGSGSTLVQSEVKQIMKVNESRGADAIVVTKGIEKVQDLRGKRIAYAVGTASHTLLINTLETAGMTINDINSYKVVDGVEAATAFKAGSCDAALVWAPDDEDCVVAVKGSKILITTKTATQIIADGLLTTNAKLKTNFELYKKICQAWLEGNALLNSDPRAKKEANALFAAGFDFPEDIAAKSADKIRFSTLGDNVKFFGYDATYTGVTGEKMYSRMAVKYAELGLVKAPASWRNVSDGSIIEALMGDVAFASSSDQKPDEPVKFTPPTKLEAAAPSNSSKVVSLEFPSASYELDDQDKTLIDREVTGLAQGLAKARIRVEGNTDNVGAVPYNVDLSQKRANAVVNYLINEHKFDKNKFIIKGNGPKNPVPGCEANADEDCKQRNRRTDFQFIWND